MSTAVFETSTEQLGTELMLPVDRVRPRADQPRQYFDEDELKQLATSIETVGQITAIEVRSVEEPGADWEIIEGERRWRAHRMLKRSKIRGIVKHPKDSDDAWVKSLIANVCRADYTPRELVSGALRLKDLGWTNVKIAAAFGRSEGWLYQYLNLRKLADDVLELMEPSHPEKNRLKLQVALLLTQIADEEMQRRLAQHVYQQAMGVQEALHYIKKEMLAVGQKVGSLSRSPRSDLRRLHNLANRLSPSIATFVELPSARFAGMFEFQDPAVVEDLVTKLEQGYNDLGALYQAAQKELNKKKEPPT